MPVAAAASSPSSLLSLSSFHAHVMVSGLCAVQSPQYDASSLYHLADSIFAFNERMTTGCFVLEAVALVQCFHLYFGKDPLSREHEQEANQFGQTSDNTRRAVDSKGVVMTLMCGSTFLPLLCYASA